jgi:hypothetical protein
MSFLHDLPNWLLGVCIVASMLGVSFAGYFAFHRVSRPSFVESNIGVALAVLSALSTTTSLLLAFSAVSVWESYGAAEESVVQEADTVGALARDLAIYDSTESRESRRLLRRYAEAVVTVEWPEMQLGNTTGGVWATFDDVFAAIGTIEPDTPRRLALLPEIWARTNELLAHRRNRLFASESQFPGTLWAVAVIGTVLTIVTTFVLPPTRFHLWMIGLLVLSLALVFWLILAMDRPFAGQENIGPELFGSAIENMERWDARQAPAAAR